jgi:hypothetical protein
MEENMNIEILGTIASVIVLLSFLMKGETKIRIVNILGALMFVIYGISINAFSIWFLNGMLIIVHITKLKR